MKEVVNNKCFSLTIDKNVSEDITQVYKNKTIRKKQVKT